MSNQPPPISNIKCPRCGSKTYVLDSRGVRRPYSIRRRRVCLKNNKHRFTTYESQLDAHALVALFSSVNRGIRELTRMRDFIKGVAK